MSKDIEELARLLPAPVRADLAPDRHRLLKEHLMQEIVDSRQQDRAPRRARPARRWLVPVAVALAVVGGLGVVALKTTADRPGTPPARAATPAGELMDHVALAAQHSPVPVPGPKQFLYVKSKVQFGSFEGDGANTWTPGTLHDREVWLTGSPAQAGMLKENGFTDSLPRGGSPADDEALGHLPTDPQQLLNRIYDLSKDGQGDKQEMAFKWIHGYVNESLPSPQVSAALFRAAALIPGVEKVDDAADAVGRHGAAIALTAADGSRSEWIFDPKSYVYLGERDVQVRDNDGIKAGTVVGLTAVLERAVVDKAGQLPG